jgi:hypothetical protein
MSNIKSKSINKKDIKFISYIYYNGYERIEGVSKKFKTIKVVGKLKQKKQIPDFENILNDILIILPYEENKNLINEVDWVVMDIVI